MPEIDIFIQKLKELLPHIELTPYESWSAHWQGQVRAAYQGDVKTLWMVSPKTVEELSVLMAEVYGHRRSILVTGQGSKLDWGAFARKVDIVVSTQYLNRLTDHAVGDMTVTLQAGMRFDDLQTILAKHNQWIPLDPACPQHATLGGIIATKDAGSLRHRYGGVRDLCLGITLVRSDGQVAKAGGRVVKNVAGYDLMKLFTGSFGTLGIVTEMTLRAYPLPECSGTVLVKGESMAIANLVQTILQSTLTPTAFDVLTGLEHLATDNLALAVRFQSLTESVAAQINTLHKMAQPLTVETLEGDTDKQWWTQTATQIQARPDRNSVFCQIGVLPALSVASLAAMQQMAVKQSALLRGRIHAGSGLGQFRLLGDEENCALVLGKLRSHCEQSGGYLSILEAPESIKQSLDLWGYSGNALSAMRKLKEQFDPQGVLNTGRFVGGI
ncbi:MAG: FAD-binding oxidoreductase [Acaryochloridaceae cyanobacterium RU_4_10]|nr:FAD-binding oxidoreductase [Acaryochloridaceae cyanobacterium RU_4_10]